jgi:formamidopyrimidine-DNA glycosylase
MPELPEVETIMCGLKPHMEGVVIQNVIVRQHQLRWPIPSELRNHLKQQQIIRLSRRGKYLLVHLTSGTLIVHLGMSGSLRILNSNIPNKNHDHVDIILSNNTMLRYNDPRRFGAILWTQEDPCTHPLIKSIGIEPLDPLFTGMYLHSRATKRQVAIKSFIMDSKVVAGIGNIYATEALFLSHIHPTLAAGQISMTEYEQLVKAIKEILTQAITAGGTTLKDFINSDGKPGYFSQKLKVYGRATLPCSVCKTPLQSLKLGQRSTFFCELCQSK